MAEKAGRFKSIVRASAYRHVFGEISKTEQWQQANFTNASHLVSLNEKYFAVPIKNGVFVNFADNPGRDNTPFQIEVHTSAVESVEFSPFDTQLIATGGGDCRVNLSRVPEGKLDSAEASVKVPLVSMTGHAKKVEHVHFHPCAANVLISGSSDNTIRTWDLEAQSEFPAYVFETDGAPTSVQWNNNGSLIAVASKNDKGLHVLDVRQKGSAQKFPEAFSGTKEASFLFADNHGLIMGVGHNARNTRQLKLFDPKKLDAGAIHTTDETQTAGALLPFWSEDNNILYTAGRGDATVRYWELANKEFHALSLFKDNKAHKGVAFAPKRACNIKKCEIARCIRVMGESPTLHIVNFLVPRKSDLFQADLYPETYAGVATMSTADFKEGNDKQPSKMSLKPGDAPVERPKAEFVAKRSAEDYEKEIAQLKAEIERLKVKAGEA